MSGVTAPIFHTSSWRGVKLRNATISFDIHPKNKQTHDTNLMCLDIVGDRNMF